MLQTTWSQVVGRSREPAGRPLLAPAARRMAAALVVACVAVTVFLGAQFAQQRRADWLDRAIDGRVQAVAGGHRGLLYQVIGIGDPIPVTLMTVALALACLAARRYRGAVLAVAVPVASALTEVLLKPLIDRTKQGNLSYPSGHSTGMFALAGVCLILLAGPSRPRIPAAWRAFLALAAYLAATAVAAAMVGLGAHYFTDTVAGAAVGTAVVLVTAFALDRFGRAEQRQSPVCQPAPEPARLSPAGSPARDTTSPGRPARR
jgi:membrane-associated phospholipid phosphatase